MNKNYNVLLQGNSKMATFQANDNTYYCFEYKTC